MVRPRLRRLGEQLDFTAEERSDPRYGEFASLHDAYVRLDAAKVVLGVATVVAPRSG